MATSDRTKAPTPRITPLKRRSLRQPSPTRGGFRSAWNSPYPASRPTSGLPTDGRSSARPNSPSAPMPPQTSPQPSPFAVLHGAFPHPEKMKMGPIFNPFIPLGLCPIFTADNYPGEWDNGFMSDKRNPKKTSATAPIEKGTPYPPGGPFSLLSPNVDGKFRAQAG